MPALFVWLIGFVRSFVANEAVGRAELRLVSDDIRRKTLVECKKGFQSP